MPEIYDVVIGYNTTKDKGSGKPALVNYLSSSSISKTRKAPKENRKSN